MSGRCRWQTIGRNDYVEPEPISVDQKVMIASLLVQRAEGMKTIFDVFKDDSFVGQVRTTWGGQFYRRSIEDEFIFVASEWNTGDPHHCMALIKLSEVAS